MFDDNKTDETCEYSIDGQCHCFGWASPDDLNKCSGTEEEQKECAVHVDHY